MEAHSRHHTYRRYGDLIGVNSMNIRKHVLWVRWKITPITNLMCGASDNQATETKCMEQL